MPRERIPNDEKFRAMWLGHMTTKEIARAYDVTPSAIIQAAARFGYRRESRKIHEAPTSELIGPLPGDQTEALLATQGNWTRLAEVAERDGLSFAQVQAAYHRAVTEDRNDRWMANVHALMAEGLGVHDIAVKLNCSVESVRLEASILRAEGLLDKIYRGRK